MSNFKKITSIFWFFGLSIALGSCQIISKFRNKGKGNSIDPSQITFIQKNESGKVESQTQLPENIIKSINISSESKKIVMLTSMAGHTLGDASAASKFMKELQQSDFEFYWIIQKSDRRFNYPDLIPDNVALIVVSNWEIIKQKPFKPFLEEMNYKIAFPTFHYLTEDQTEFLSSLEGKYVRITEYDFMEDLSTPYDVITLKTGFCKTCLGIMQKKIETNLPSGKLGDLYDILKKNGKEFYFGYFNKWEENEYSGSYSNLVNFVTLVILMEAIKPRSNKPTYILTTASDSSPLNHISKIYQKISKSLNSDELDPKIREKLKKLKIRFSSGINIHQSKSSINEELGSQTADPFLFHIINPFPLPPTDLPFFLKNSSFLTGLTGDQSLSEGIQLDKLIYYQVMDWKKDLAINFALETKNRQNLL